MNSNFFGEDSISDVAQLNGTTDPLDLIDSVKCDQFMDTSIVSSNNQFQTSIPNTSSYQNVSAQRDNITSPPYSLPSQPNLQVKNVSLPVQNPTTVIISSPNIQHNAQPLVYTSLPVENHIILQKSNLNSQMSSQKNTPVILQNIQQPVLLTKLIKSENQVGFLQMFVHVSN